MRIDTPNFGDASLGLTKKPRYVVRVSFDTDNTDLVYFTSHPATETPSGSTVISDVVRGISGTSQKINPNEGNSTIGGFSFSIVDKDSAITESVRDKLNGGDALRHKRVVCYVGYEDLLWEDYKAIITYVIDEISYKDGTYTFKCSDIQRIIRKNIFEPEVTNLSKSVNAYQGHIPATTTDLTLFPAIKHDSSYSDRPSEDVTYIQVEDEVIATTGGLFTHGTDGPSFEVFSDYSESHTDGTSTTVFKASGSPFVADALIGLLLENVTDGSEGVIIDNTNNTATVEALTGGTDNDFDNSDVIKIYTGRGQLNTKAVEHSVDTSKANDRRPKITEHIFLAGAAPKVAYQVMTGFVEENMLAYSEQINTQPPWTGVNYARSADLDVAPNGETTAERCLANTANSDHYIYQTVTAVVGEKYTASVHLGYTDTKYYYFGLYHSSTYWSHICIDLETKTIVRVVSNNMDAIDYGIIDVGGRYCRPWITAEAKTTSLRVIFGELPDIADPFTVGSPAGFIGGGYNTSIWGAQLTNTDGVTPYTYSGATAVTAKSLPNNWNLGVKVGDIKLQDYAQIGKDYWDVYSDEGRHVRFQGMKSTDGKKFVEKEIMFWLASFMPIYSDGKIGLKRLSPVLSDSGHVVTLDSSNIVDYSALVNDYKSVINQMIVSWNYNWQKDEYTKPSVLLDAESVSIYQEAPIKTIELRGVHTGSHTDEQVNSYFDSIRDRYSGAPLLLNVGILPSLNNLEVGDVVRVTLEQIRDFNVASGTTLDRAFEIQQVTTDWMTGKQRLSLFGSSRKAGSLVRTQSSSVLHNDFYSGSGTNVTGVLTMSGGNVTANGTLTGGETMEDGIYYYLGNMVIDAGVTVNIEKNVELRVRGSLTINGTLNGKGLGHTGSAGISTFNNGTTTGAPYNWIAGRVFSEELKVMTGTPGYIGSSKVMAGISLSGYSGGRARVQHDDLGGSVGISRVDGDVDAVNYFNVTNWSTYITGAPTNLMGTSGGGGSPVLYQASSSSNRELVASGGTGGNGGSGLLIISRGLSFGVSGEIDLSGNDGIIGSSYSYLGKTFYAGSGSGGSNGGLVVLLDGLSTPPDMTDDYLVANYGGYAIEGTSLWTRLRVGSINTSYVDQPIGTIPFDPIHAGGLTILEQNYWNPYPAQNRRASSYSLQYLPVSAVVEEEVQPPPPDVQNLTATNDGLDALLSWDAVENVDTATYEIKSGATWATGTSLGKSNSTTFRVLNPVEDTVDFMVKAISVDGQESETEASISLNALPEVVLAAKINGADAYNKDSYYISPSFESLDGFSNAPTSTYVVPLGVVLIGNGGNNATIWRQTTSAVGLAWTKNRHFKARVRASSATGNMATGEYFQALVGTGGSEGFGIKFVWNATTSLFSVYLYTRVTPGIEYTTLITTCADTTFVDIECDFYAGDHVTGKVTIGGTTYVTPSTHGSTQIPQAATSDDVFFYCYLQVATSFTAASYLLISEWAALQE